jgi:DNA-directed RNA polymerase specialized sigma24 family protein
VIFVLDVEKCIRQLDPVSRKLVTYVVLEDYSLLQAVDLMGRSPRTVARIYGDAMDRLTSFFLQFGLLVPNVEKLSRGEAEIEGNGTT